MKKFLLLCAAVLMLALAGCTAPAGLDASSLGGSRLITAETAVDAPVHMEYADTLFDTSFVHTIDIQVPDDGTWDDFIANCEDEEYIACDLVIDGELYQNAAIRGKGNSSKMRSRSSGKYSFKVEFDHFRSETFHGLDKLGLNNLVVDDSCQRDYVTYRMMDKFGVPSPLCSYVFITVNGEDWGFYLAVEAVEESFLERNFGTEYGALYKPDTSGGGGGMGRSNDTKLIYIDNDPASYPNIFGSAKANVSRKDQYRLIESLRKLNEGEDIPAAVDTEAMLRYLVVHTYVCNGDSYTGSSAHNYYLYEEDGRMSMIPWDYNEAFGEFGASGAASVVNAPIDSPVTSGSLEDRPMVAWVFSDEEYIDRYHTLYAEFLTQLWDSGWLRNEIESARDLIGPFVQRDTRSFTTYEKFLSGTEELLTFFDLRSQSVRGQLDGTIPSTTEGQRADSSALVDTSALGGASGEMGGSPGGSRGQTQNRQSSGESSGENTRARSEEASGEGSGENAGTRSRSGADGSADPEDTGRGASGEAM